MIYCRELLTANLFRKLTPSMITFLIKWSIVLWWHSHAPFAAHHLQSPGFSNQYSMAQRKLPNAGASQHFLTEIYQGNNQARKLTRRVTPFLRGWSGFLTSRCWDSILHRVRWHKGSAAQALPQGLSILLKALLWNDSQLINLHKPSCGTGH